MLNSRICLPRAQTEKEKTFFSFSHVSPKASLGFDHVTVYPTVTKNDLGPRSKKFAYGDTPEVCLVSKMRLYLDSTGLRIQPDCRKWTQSGGVGVKCAKCGPLFPVTTYDRPTTDPATRLPLNKGSVGKALTALLDVIGAEYRDYNTESMCRGGVVKSGHRSKDHTVYESDSSSGEDAVGVSRSMPRGGWRVEDLYHCSSQFGLKADCVDVWCAWVEGVWVGVLVVGIICGSDSGTRWREDGEGSVVDDGDDGGSGKVAQSGLDSPSRMVGRVARDRIYILSIFAPLVLG
jgi:hypothetical protein